MKTLPSCLIALVFLLAASPTWAGVKPWEMLIRRMVQVADDVPLRQADEVAERLAKNRAVRRSIDDDLLKAGKLADKADDATRVARRALEVKSGLRAMLTGSDPALLRHLDTLDDAAQETALVLAKGGQTLTKTLPDIAARGRLLKTGGPDVVAAVGLYGDDAAKAVLRLDAALNAGRVIVPAGKSLPTLADFGRVLSRTGDTGWTFWNRYVLPHWKLWLGSGALAAYLADPDLFQNAAGELTEAGFKHLTEFAGAAAAGAIRGIGEGSGKAVEQISGAVQESVLGSWQNIVGVSALLLILALLLFRRVRYYALLPLRWLNRTPGQGQ